jgi:hypothetical protein
MGNILHLINIYKLHAGIFHLTLTISSAPFWPAILATFLSAYAYAYGVRNQPHNCHKFWFLRLKCEKCRVEAGIRLQRMGAEE